MSKILNYCIYVAILKFSLLLWCSISITEPAITHNLPLFKYSIFVACLYLLNRHIRQYIQEETK